MYPLSIPLKGPIRGDFSYSQQYVGLVQAARNVHTETNFRQMFGHIFGQVFGQVFDQGFDQVFDQIFD